MPHGGELRGPEHIRICLDELHAHRLGHGVRAAEDPALLDRIVEAGVALEVCPVSNVALGVYSDLTSVPLPTLLAAGATVALGADDPLLFGSRLAGQYATMRAAHELTDDQLAELARMSVRASRAPDDVKSAILGDVDAVAADRPCEDVPMTTGPENPYGEQQPPQPNPYYPQQQPPPPPYGAPQPEHQQPGQQGYQQPGQPGYQQPGQPGYQQPGQPGQPPYGYDYAPPPPSHPSANTAMVLGIIGLAGIALCGGITLVLSPFAWVIGAKASREIDASPGHVRRRGRGLRGQDHGHHRHDPADPRGAGVRGVHRLGGHLRHDPARGHELELARLRAVRRHL